MAQKTFKRCVTFSTLPDLRAPDYGRYTVTKHPCLGDTRKTDGNTRVAHIIPLDNVLGIASDDPRPTESIGTEQGPITLGKGPLPSVDGYTPNTIALQAAGLAGSRFSGISDRYY
jgi:hypothetical protein